MTRPAAAILIVCGAAFGFLAAALIEGRWLAGVDARVAEALRGAAAPGLRRSMLWASVLHSSFVLCIAAALVAAALAWRGLWTRVLEVLLVVPGGLAMNALLKQAFERGRPLADDPLLALQSYSFPSGHTAGALLFYGLLGALAWPRLRPWGRPLCVLGVALAVAVVGFSRLVLGVHYLSDVLAAAAWSGAWLALCLSAGSRARPSPA